MTMVRRWREARHYLQDSEATIAAAPSRDRPSLARDVVVASLDPVQGRWSPHAGFMTAAALMVELVHEGRLEVAGTGKKVTVTVSDATPLGDELLDDALVTVGCGLFGQKVRRLIRFMPFDSQILERLVAAGEVDVEGHRTLLLLRSTRYRPAPAAQHEALVARIRSALLGELVPDEHTALLISCLAFATRLERFVGKEHRRDADRRAEEIRERLTPDEQAVIAAVRQAWLDDASD